VGVALGRSVGLGERFRSASGGRNPQETGAERRGVNDRVVVVPRSAEGVGGIGDADRSASSDLCLLQLSTREERR